MAGTANTSIALGITGTSYSQASYQVKVTGDVNNNALVPGVVLLSPGMTGQPVEPAQDGTLTAGGMKTQLTDGTHALAMLNSAPIGTEYALPVRPIPGTLAQPISAASLPLPAGAAQDATLTGGTQQSKVSDGTHTAALLAAAPAGTEYGLVTRNIPGTAAQPTSAAAGALVDVGTQADAAYAGSGNSTIIAALKGLYNKLAGVLNVALPKSTTGTASSVAGTTTPSTTILAGNANRLGASFFNDSTATLYLCWAATCTTTAFALKLGPGDYYSLEFAYTGVVTGVWDSASGNCRVVELTP